MIVDVFSEVTVTVALVFHRVDPASVLVWCSVFVDQEVRVDVETDVRVVVAQCVTVVTALFEPLLIFSFCEFWVRLWPDCQSLMRCHGEARMPTTSMPSKNRRPKFVMAEQRQYRAKTWKERKGRNGRRILIYYTQTQCGSWTGYPSTPCE